MAAWSTLFRLPGQNLVKNRLSLVNLIPKNVVGNTQTRSMSDTMVIKATRWQWDKTKDTFHFYFFVGAIPITIIIFCSNIFVGPATLSPIPEGYVPKYWEYYRHPISRFLARYIYCSPQKDYEKSLHAIWIEGQVIEVRKLEKKVWALMAERQDYKYNYFIPYNNSATKEFRELLKRSNDNME
ncbi:hypothetical protein QAD02_022276 [Eretmocerus hayati]|uniref:Uncharacterized protein n=1 Tax=Eretmocerus hayati TaxID=131215 RepID=A0ACC2PST9_9HYME|nr:hypothetical protein QAD02_022276 [Eretmocerus hayati]